MRHIWQGDTLHFNMLGILQQIEIFRGQQHPLFSFGVKQEKASVRNHSRLHIAIHSGHPGPEI